MSHIKPASRADLDRSPNTIGSLCCGTPWKSKGILDGYHAMVERTTVALWEASDKGRPPVVCDNSSCSEGLVLAVEKAIEKHAEYHSMRIIDAVDFTAEVILPLLVVTIPDDWTCCGFAGDRGTLHPELTASAIQHESDEIQTSDFDAYVSCNRTCEIGMTRTTGHPYQHVLEVLDKLSSAARNGKSDD